MDEKNQNSLTITDILDQLAKPSVLISPEPPSSRPDSSPKSLNPPPKTLSSDKSEINLPQLGSRPDGGGSNVGSSSSSFPTSPSLSADLKLYIRTMAGDITRLKQGQKPSVLEVTKPTELPKPIQQKEPPKPPPILQNQPIRPPPIVAPPRSSSPPPIIKPQYKQEHFHPEKVISGTQNEKPTDDTLPPFLGAPVPVPKKKVTKPEDEKVEYGLIARVVGSGMTTGILGTILIAVVAYFAISYFVFNQEEIALPTPTPTLPIVTTTPTSNELELLFDNVLISNLTLSDNKQQAITDFKAFAENQIFSNGPLTQINLTDSENKKLIFSDILKKLSVELPNGLISELNNSVSLTLVHDQKESFDPDKSKPVPNTLVFIVEIKDPRAVITIMQGWEKTIANDFKDLFGLDTSKESGPNFLDNDYRSVKIRYKNFPFPDRSLDYAITNSLSGKNYLIITNSRESMYSPINIIKGL